MHFLRVNAAPACLGLLSASVFLAGTTIGWGLFNSFGWGLLQRGDARAVRGNHNVLVVTGKGVCRECERAWPRVLGYQPC